MSEELIVIPLALAVVSSAFGFSATAVLVSSFLLTVSCFLLLADNREPFIRRADNARAFTGVNKIALCFFLFSFWSR